MNTKDIINCGINNTIFIISNNIIITMGSTMWRLGCPCATWQLGHQVMLEFALRSGAARAPGGARVCPA